MIFDLNNPWVIAISIFISGAILSFLLRYRKEKTTKDILKTSLNNADIFLEKNMTEDALAICDNLLKVVSEKKKDPKIYAYIKSSEGICYFNLAIISNKEYNLTKSIRAFEEALKIYTVEKYPIYYSTTKNNLGNAYSNLSAVRDKEDNLIKSIRSHEDALKIRTVEKYPIDYAKTQNTLGIAYGELSAVRDKKGNLTKSIQAFKESLKIYTVEKYPLDHKGVMSNLEIVKQMRE